jgi:hypothetical protein
MDRPNFLKICRDCELLGEDFIIADMNLLYLEATKAPPGVNVKVSGLLASTTSFKRGALLFWVWC